MRPSLLTVETYWRGDGDYLSRRLFELERADLFPDACSDDHPDRPMRRLTILKYRQGKGTAAERGMFELRRVTPEKDPKPPSPKIRWREFIEGKGHDDARAEFSKWYGALVLERAAAIHVATRERMAETPWTILERADGLVGGRLADKSADATNAAKKPRRPGSPSSNADNIATARAEFARSGLTKLAYAVWHQKRFGVPERTISEVWLKDVARPPARADSKDELFSP